MHLFDEPKIDCHCHILDPARFAYRADTPYRPSGQEIGTYRQMRAVFETYGVKGAVVVQPNSGYGEDNACLLDALSREGGRMKGIAVVPLGIGLEALSALREAGMVGVAINPSLMGTDYYLAADPLLEKLAALGMVLNIQTEKDQLADLLPLFHRHDTVRLVIDHCGRPDIAAGPDQRGFRTLLDLGKSRRATVKLSGYAKFARTEWPFTDTWPFVQALVEAFTLDHCIWASDWPFLKATERHDVGPMIGLVARLFPDAADRRKLWWETPRRVFGFDG